MDGSVKNLSEFMRGSSRFYIPVYQRNYDWRIDNCKRLLDDLIKIHSEKRNTHFFGSLVVKPGDLHQETVIIDGQQRLTTVSILLLAIANWLKDNHLEDRQINAERIITTYLIDEWAKPGDNYRLKSNPKDFKAYKALFDNSKYHIETSNITRNYQYFYEQLKDIPITIHKMMDSLRRLEIMIVNLNSPEDDPQLIFESLNSTGLDLTDADRIRNFLLMNEEKAEQEFLYHHFWEPIEERTHLDLNEFFRQYLTLKMAKTPRKNDIYETFQSFYSKTFDSKRNFFEDLTEYSLAYKQILENHTGSRRIDVILYRFNRIEITVIHSFLMAILRDYNEGEIVEDEVVNILVVIESYIARRMITQTPSNALSKIMATLYRDVGRSMSPEYEISEVVAYILLNKKRSGYFPDDEDVINALKSRDMYNINSRFRTYFFERLENTNHAETLNVYEGVEEGDFSIEHIMPQKLSATWVEELGTNHQEIHKTYLNNLGNLTLTGYNSKYSNRPFIEKKTIDKGFNDSHFSFLNQLAKRNNQWSEGEILERRNALISQALETWKLPTTSYIPPKVDDGSRLYVYDGEESFTAYKINGYTFRNDEYREANTWRQMFDEVVKEVATENPDEIVELARNDNNIGLTWLFTSENVKLSNRILPGIYAKNAMSNWSKMNLLTQLFDRFDIEYEELKLDAVPPKE